MRIGSFWGIPLYIDSSWLLILGLVTILNAGDVNASGLSGDNALIGWVTGLIMALLLFGSVLLHELGHSLVAKSQGIIVNSITLFLFGGIASIERESKTPGQALQVAIAGPIVSIVLFILFFSLNQFFNRSELLNFLTLDLARINLILALFNLIPGLPLDGGQALKAIVWKITGDRFAGVHWAAASGKFFGFLGIAGGLLIFLQSGEIGGLWFSLIGWFVLRNANSYDRVTSLQEVLLELVASDAMTREFKVVNGKLNLKDFAAEYILADPTHPVAYYAASDGRYRGLIRVGDLQAIERSEWETKTVEEIAHPLTEIPSVQEKAKLTEAIEKLEKSEDNRITVLTNAGAVAGVIDRGDIVKTIAQEQNLPIPDSEIKRIKTEGTYPANLPLGSIVRQLSANSDVE